MRTAGSVSYDRGLTLSDGSVKKQRRETARIAGRYGGGILDAREANPYSSHLWSFDVEEDTVDRIFDHSFYVYDDWMKGGGNVAGVPAP